MNCAIFPHTESDWGHTLKNVMAEKNNQETTRWRDVAEKKHETDINAWTQNNRMGVEQWRCGQVAAHVLYGPLISRWRKRRRTFTWILKNIHEITYNRNNKHTQKKKEEKKKRVHFKFSSDFSNRNFFFNFYTSLPIVTIPFIYRYTPYMFLKHFSLLWSMRPTSDLTSAQYTTHSRVLRLTEFLVIFQDGKTTNFRLDFSPPSPYYILVFVYICEFNFNDTNITFHSNSVRYSIFYRILINIRRVRNKYF